MCFQASPQIWCRLNNGFNAMYNNVQSARVKEKAQIKD